MRHFFLAAMILATIMGCQDAPPKKAEPAKKITLAYTTQPNCGLIHIAKAKGYFVEEGLDVQPQIHLFGKPALQSMLDKKADLATAAETPVMFAILKGEKINVIAGIYTSRKNNAIIGRRDLGISNPRDLKGKKIGVSLGTSGDFFADSFFTANGFSYKEVQIVPLKPDEMLPALLAKQVDAVSVWNPQLTQIVKELGNGGVVFYDTQIYTETFNVSGHQDFIENNPETIRQFLKALVKAEAFLAGHEEESKDVIAAAMKVEKSLLEETWKNYKYQLNLDRTLLITMGDEARWAIENKLTDQKNVPNFRNSISIDGLKALKPDAISIDR